MMPNILIGSRALNYWHPEMRLPVATDWDVISPSPIVGTEWHNPLLVLNAELDKYTSSSTVEYNGKALQVLSMKGLSLVKRSHLHRELKFSRHIAHYWHYLEKEKAKWDASDIEFLAARTAATKVAFPQRSPVLSKKVHEFFADAVKRKFEHDYLHVLLKYNAEPMYTRLQLDKSSTYCHESLWAGLTGYEKLQCVAEEAYVIAVERYLVPAQWDFYPKQAFSLAVNKLCTTLCSGWFREWGIDNYPAVLGMFDCAKIEKVKLILERDKNEI